MKFEIKTMLLQKFFLDHIDALDFQKNDVDKWIIEAHEGIRPDRNVFYDLRNAIMVYLKMTRAGIYRIDEKKAEKFLQGFPEAWKEYKGKRAKA